jgi:hypothetical protein
VSDPTGSQGKSWGAEAVRTARSLGDFIAPAFRPLVGLAEDQFLAWRAKRQVRLADRFREFLRERGLSGATRAVAPAFMLPLVERASIEADDALQDVWAMMLTNAADADCHSEMRTAFTSMLGEMTHLDVVILAKLSEAVSPEKPDKHLPTWNLPDAVRFSSPGAEPTGELAVSLANLARLGCILPRGAHGATLGFAVVTPTALAQAFVAACTRPAGPPAS